MSSVKRARFPPGSRPAQASHAGAGSRHVSADWGIAVAAVGDTLEAGEFNGVFVSQLRGKRLIGSDSHGLRSLFARRSEHLERSVFVIRWRS
jgi:hypothetical protein